MTAGDVFPIEVFARPAIRESHLVAAALRHGLVLDDTDGHDTSLHKSPAEGPHPLPGQLGGHHTNTDGLTINFYVMKRPAVGLGRKGVPLVERARMKDGNRRSLVRERPAAPDNSQPRIAGQPKSLVISRQILAQKNKSLGSPRGSQTT